MRIKPVIIAGGQGVRLWPLSRSLYPKQFIRIFDKLSLLQKTLVRNKSYGKVTVIIVKEHEYIVRKQAKELDIEVDLIIEPAQKNTAMCALNATLKAKEDGFDTIMLFPADHYISDHSQYMAAIDKALKYVSQLGICTIGIPISSPNTEYGYIKISNVIEENIYCTSSFTEKPDLVKAQNYLDQGGYFWNSGIFIYNTDFMLEQARAFQPDLLDKAKNALSLGVKDKNSIRLDLSSYKDIEPISIDQAIIQHISKMIMVKGDFQWSDLGSWQALWGIRNKDKTNNYCEGNIVLSNTTNSYISSKKNLLLL